MLGVFSDIKSLLKVGGISIDNWVFKLHYKLTVILLIVFSIIVNSRQYFGDPIDCTKQGTEIDNYVDTYCWFNSYTMVDKAGNVYLQVRKLHSQAIDKGTLDKYPGNINEFHPVKQTFYQWIGVVLLLQAACFYAPRFLWKNLFEEGRVKELVGVGTRNSRIIEEDELLKRHEKIIEYVKIYRGHHLFYAMKFFVCEFLNFANVIAQIFITDWFLGHAFLNYGLQWLWYDVDDDEHAVFHPSFRYFPKETMCDVYYGGPSERKPNIYNARCILPIHIFNEKIYLFLWFYFIALAVISAGMLIYRALVLLFPDFRYYLFARRAWATDEKILKTVVYDFDIGDWFIVYQIMKNMDPFIFGKLMRRVYDRTIRTKPSIVADDSQDHLLGVYSSDSNYDIEEKHNKLNNTSGPGY